MLKLPKGLKKKKKKSKKDQELFTEEELEQYKRQQRAKQEAAAAKSDAGESDPTSDVEGLASSSATSSAAAAAAAAAAAGRGGQAPGAATQPTAQGAHSASASACNDHDEVQKEGVDDEWAKFKALTSGVDSILHRTQDELDRIKKESFYQRLPSAAEKKKLEEEEAARAEAARLEEERRKAAEFEAQRDKLAEAVVELSDSDGDDEAEVGDIFATDYIDSITRGEVLLGVVPDSPDLDVDEGPDPFDTAYAEKVIVGADKAKGNKKLVSLGAAVEVLSGRVDREHALALAKPKRKQRKGIQNLLLSESVDFGDADIDVAAPEPQQNLLDVLDDEVPESDAPIDLSVSLHLHLIQHKKPDSPEEEDDAAAAASAPLDLSEFDTLHDDEDDEFAELAAESLTKKEEVKVITQIPLPQPEVLSEVAAADWAEFEQEAEEPLAEGAKAKPARPPPPARPNTGPHIVPGAIYVSDDEDENLDDDPFNTTYADEVIKKTTALEEDDDFDPRAEEEPDLLSNRPVTASLAQPPRDLLGGSSTDLSAVGQTPIAPTEDARAPEEDSEDFDPFDTSGVSAIVQPKATELKFLERELLTEGNLKHSLSDPDFDPRAEEPPSPVPAQPAVGVQIQQPQGPEFDAARLQDRDLLGAANEGSGNKKPLTPYYAPTNSAIHEKESDDPFDTTFLPQARPSEVELNLLDQDTLNTSLSDHDFDPRAKPVREPAEDLLFVKENINIKVLTPAQESKDLADELPELIDPFDTSIAANLQPGKAELKLIENELLPATTPEITTGVLDTQTDAQELGLGDKVLTPSVPIKQLTLPEEVDPFDTSIAENLAPGETEIKLLEIELIER